MKKNTIKKVFAGFALAIAMATCSFGALSAYAATSVYPKDQTAAESAGVSWTQLNGGEAPANATYVLYDDNGNAVSYSTQTDVNFKPSGGSGGGGSASQVYDAKSANDVMRGLETGLQITPDTQHATKSLQGFIPVISFILGAVVLLISVGMTIFSAFDICYIAFPTFRQKCEDSKASGGAMASSKKDSNGEAKMRFITDEAIHAVQESETIKTGKNPFVIYFKKRILAYLLLAITVFILLTGNVTVLTNLAVKLVSGILDIIQELTR